MPTTQRRLAVIVMVIFVALLVVGLVTVSLLTAAPIDWFWIVAIVVVCSGFIGAFLWVRLSH